MNQFDIIYEKILSEANLFGHLPDVENEMIAKYEKPNLKDVLDNLVSFDGSEKYGDPFKGSYILDEAKHPEVNYGNKILDKINDRIKELPTFLSKDELISWISRTWKYYDVFKEKLQDKKIIIIGWNSKKISIFLKIFLDALNIHKDNYEPDEFNEFHDLMKHRFLKSDGMFYESIDSYFLMFDFEKITRTLISHEFTHLVQTILNVNFLKDNLNQHKITSQILSDEDFKYVTKDKEFWTIIFNELYQGLQKIYWKKYKDESYEWTTFIYAKIQCILPELIYNQDIYNDWIDIIKTIPLCIKILAVIKLENTKLFNEIIEKLKETK